MKEAQLRKMHRTAGMVFMLFIVLQALSGLVLTIQDMSGVYWGNFVRSLHMRFDTAGDIYRLIAGTGMLFMAMTGLWIGVKIRMRRKISSAP